MYPNKYDRSFRMVSISFLNEDWEKRETRPVLICWAQSKEAYGTIFITSGTTRSGIEPTTSRSRGECSNHWAAAF